MSDQQITVVGNLTTDPILRYTAAGRGSITSTIAVNRRYQVNGEWQEQVAFINITAFGQIAEHIAASCNKGTRVIVTGRFESGEYTDKEGVNRKTMQLIVEDLGASLKFATAQIDRIARSTPTVSTNRTAELEEDPF